MADRFDAKVQRQGHARRPHFIGQHFDDVLGAVVAEQLAKGFFVIGDAVPLDHFDKVVLGKPLQRRQRKARIFAKIGGRMDAQIGEVTAPAARNADLFARGLGVIDHPYAATALSGFDGAHHTGGTGTNDQDIQSL